jgi:hypothetical protein
MPLFGGIQPAGLLATMLDVLVHRTPEDKALSAASQTAAQ